jgi:GH15 family glucan-1,4-alpha-glucosidase
LSNAASDRQTSATIDAIRRDLGTGPLVYRYSGAREECDGAFMARAFLMVSALPSRPHRRVSLMVAC